MPCKTCPKGKVLRCVKNTYMQKFCVYGFSRKLKRCKRANESAAGKRKLAERKAWSKAHGF